MKSKLNYNAKIPSYFKPSGLSCSHRRPDLMSVVPWTSGKLLVRDATCSDAYAPSNIGVAVTGAGAVTEKSEQHKISKYSRLDWTYMFIPLAVETSGVFGPQSLQFIKNLGRCLKTATGEANSKQCCLQKILVAIQRRDTSSVFGTLGQQEGLFDPTLLSVY